MKYTHACTHTCAFCVCHAATINVIFNLSLWVMPWKKCESNVKSDSTATAKLKAGRVKEAEGGRVWDRGFFQNAICMHSSQRDSATNFPTFVHIYGQIDSICIQIKQ